MIIVHWSENTGVFLGRNGYGKLRGVEIIRGQSDSDMVMLTAITSRSNAGKCHLTIPAQQARIMAQAILRITRRRKP
jgi:hypothetical protein